MNTATATSAVIVTSTNTPTATNTPIVTSTDTPTATNTPIVETQVFLSESDVLIQSGESKRYTFEVSIGQVLYFDAHTSSDDLGWEVRHIDGTFISSDRSFGDMQVQFSQPGNYVLTISGSLALPASDAANISYQFRVLDVVVDALPIETNTSIMGALPVQYFTDVYIFSVDEEQVLYFDAHTSSDDLGWEVRHVDGTFISSDRSFGDMQVQFSQAGDYILIVSGSLALPASDAATISYQFRVIEVATEALPIETNTSIMGALPVQYFTDVYIFSVDEEQVLYFDAHTSSDDLGWEVRHVDGTFISSDRSFGDMQVQFSQAGDYILIVSGSLALPASDAANISYEFQVETLQ